MATVRPVVMEGGKRRLLRADDTIEGLNMGTPRIWVGGSTVYDQAEDVISSLDWDTYRKTAPGGVDTVDPADDVTKYKAMTYDRIPALGLVAARSEAANQGVWGINIPKTTLPLITMGSRTLLGSVSGRGHARILSFYLSGTTTVNARFEILIDGRSVFDYTIAISNNFGLLFLGDPMGTGNNAYHYFQSSPFKVPFRRSFQVFVTPVNANINANSYFQMVFQPEA